MKHICNMANVCGLKIGPLHVCPHGEAHEPTEGESEILCNNSTYCKSLRGYRKCVKVEYE